MSRSFSGWPAVATALRRRAEATPESRLNAGQKAALDAVAERINDNGVLIADEVGMGKTRIAVEVAASVIACRGRVAIVIPPGLGYQWRAELRESFASRMEEVAIPEFLRSLAGFFDPWRDNSPNEVKARSWFSESLVLVSHAFTNWRLGERSRSWRWGLLPALYVAARKELGGRFPRGHAEIDALRPTVQRAAEDICEASRSRKTRTARRVLNAILEQTPWPSALDASQYGKHDELRTQLENAVGLGLGSFDLIVVDEAHKSRGDASRLSSLLANVIHANPEARRLALTATPVELEAAQWSSTLARVGLSQDIRNTLTPVINRYAEATRKLRVSWRTSAEAKNEYLAAADAFERELTPYVLRRDKREDPIVQRFATSTGRQPEEYRREDEVAVHTASLSRNWKQIVCAAEALSVSTRLTDNSAIKRLRLSMGNGHGIAALMDQIQRDPEDREPLEDDAPQEETESVASAAPAARSKHEARIAWWRHLLDTAVAASSTENPLFEHPAILAAIEAVEAETRDGEKVLVFGRFTRPMRALASLLNAREMLRRLSADEPWPEAKVASDEWAAVRAARTQMKSELSLDDLDKMLETRYAKERRERAHQREKLLARLRGGLRPSDRKALALLAVFEARANSGSADEDRHPLVLVTRALTELNPDLESESDWGQAFTELVDGVTDRDEGDDDGDGELDSEEAGRLWALIEERLDQEFNRPQGRFARLMNGQTPQATRRTLQLAFNRPKSFPKVLIAQSLVGREGLNLHRACHTVILLHPEWNPGVVEQQIGRVDRVGSRWEQLMQAPLDQDRVPQIKIRPIVFQGTYDEHNWQVLRERWDDHRAQLHGVPVPPRLAFDDAESAALIKELAAVAPNFSPLKQRARRR